MELGVFFALSQALPFPGPTGPSSRKAVLPRSWDLHEAVLSHRVPFGIIDGQPPQWALCPPAMCPQARGRLSSRTSGFPPGEGMCCSWRSRPSQPSLCSVAGSPFRRMAQSRGPGGLCAEAQWYGRTSFSSWKHGMSEIRLSVHFSDRDSEDGGVDPISKM